MHLIVDGFGDFDGWGLGDSVSGEEVCSVEKLESYSECVNSLIPRPAAAPFLKGDFGTLAEASDSNGFVVGKLGWR
jgi:hypothetical protein